MFTPIWDSNTNVHFRFPVLAASISWKIYKKLYLVAFTFLFWVTWGFKKHFFQSWIYLALNSHIWILQELSFPRGKNDFPQLLFSRHYENLGHVLHRVFTRTNLKTHRSAGVQDTFGQSITCTYDLVKVRCGLVPSATIIFHVGNSENVLCAQTPSM